MMFLPFVIPLVGFCCATVLGLGIWRYQLIARRKYQVAEQALTVAHQAVADIHAIRRAVSDSHRDEEQYPDAIHVQPWLAINSRVQASSANFENLRTTLRLVTMHFGDSAATPFWNLDNIYNKICTAQMDVYWKSKPEKMYPTPETQGKSARLSAFLGG